jgi:hypothetical protein
MTDEDIREMGPKAAQVKIVWDKSNIMRNTMVTVSTVVTVNIKRIYEVAMVTEGSVFTMVTMSRMRTRKVSIVTMECINSKGT